MPTRSFQNAPGRARAADARAVGAFSLIELAVVIVIIGILSGLSLGFIGHWTGLYTTLLAQKRVEGEMFATVEQLRRELRTLRSIDQGASNKFSFFNAQGAKIALDYSAAQFSLNQQPLAQGVAVCEFQYFSVNEGKLATPLSPGDFEHLARIQLTLRITNQTAAAQTIVNFYLLEGYLK
ncbi:MAG: prepilin-type N-terminal cleavage/methylation domain-containing protein [Lentisphaerae bacterium]|nr:prepilin-type N-terminal cleavage/methylation domain-containing protein [Lentisphaerota bacterium]